MNVRLAISLLLITLGLPAISAADATPSSPPVPPSPVEDFRRWLKMNPADREKELAAYPEQKRTVLRRKIETYQAMPAEQRDARLRMLELRWYLPPLMARSPQERTNVLSMIPAHLHAPIHSRLAHWDNLDEPTRREILANDTKRELVTGYFVLPRPAPTPPFPGNLPPHPAGLNEHFKRWETKSLEARERMSRHLSTYFQMPPEEQQKTLNSLSDSERQEMQNTLDAFARLPLEERRACVQSFQRLATMAPHERASFLRNAHRWQQLTPQERATWRELVSRMPPMPPFPELPVPSLPATNRNLASTNSSPTVVN